MIWHYLFDHPQARAAYVWLATHTLEIYTVLLILAFVAAVFL